MCMRCMDSQIDISMCQTSTSPKSRASMRTLLALASKVGLRARCKLEGLEKVPQLGLRQFGLSFWIGFREL